MRRNVSTLLTFKVAQEALLIEFLMEKMHGISRNRAKALISNRVVLVNNAITTHPLTELKAGQVVQVDRSKRKMAFHSNELDIVYEDPYLLIIDKHPGLLSMSNNSRQQTVQSVLNRYLEKGGGRNTSHLVHRLDRDTSGLMVYAKDVQTQQSLVRGWQQIISSRRMSLSTTSRVLCSLSFMRARGVTAPETTPRFASSISSVQKLRRETPSFLLTCP